MYLFLLVLVISILSLSKSFSKIEFCGFSVKSDTSISILDSELAVDEEIDESSFFA